MIFRELGTVEKLTSLLFSNPQWASADPGDFYPCEWIERDRYARSLVAVARFVFEVQRTYVINLCELLDRKPARASTGIPSFVKGAK
jgi:hypothetical protein